jgi:hypothetical protein
VTRYIRLERNKSKSEYAANSFGKLLAHCVANSITKEEFLVLLGDSSKHNDDIDIKHDIDAATGVSADRPESKVSAT